MPQVQTDSRPNQARAERKFAPALVALAETGLVFLLFFSLIKYLETTRVGWIQFYLVGWDFFAHLVMALFPFAFFLLAGRSVSNLGLTRSDFRNPIIRRFTRVAVAELAVIWVAAFLIPHWARGQRPAPLLPPEYFTERLGLSPWATSLTGWGLTVLFTMIFCGVSEEIFFRGYIQGRLNRAWGRPFRLFGVPFGGGLILASAMFGLGHGLGYFNPFTDPLASFQMDWTQAVVTFAEGLLFGFLYEHTNSIVAPIAVHAFVGLFFGAIIFPG